MTISTEEEMKGAVDRDLRALQIAKLENWATEMDRSAKAMLDIGLIDAAQGNKTLAADLRAASRTIMNLVRTSTTPTRSQGEGETAIVTDCWKAIGEWIGFSASVIKSGEPWTATCEDRYQKARQGADRLRQHPVQPAEGGDGLLEATIELRTIETVADYLEATGLKPFWVRAVRRLQDLYPAAIAKASRPSTEAGGERG